MNSSNSTKPIPIYSRINCARRGGILSLVLRSIFIPKSSTAAAQLASSFGGLAILMQVAIGSVDQETIHEYRLLFTVISVILLLLTVYYLLFYLLTDIKNNRQALKKAAELESRPGVVNYRSVNYDNLPKWRLYGSKSEMMASITFVGFGLMYVFTIFTGRNRDDVWSALAGAGLVFILPGVLLLWKSIKSYKREKHPLINNIEFAARNNFTLNHSEAGEIGQIYREILMPTHVIPANSRIYTEMTGEYRSLPFSILVVGPPKTGFAIGAVNTVIIIRKPPVSDDLVTALSGDSSHPFSYQVHAIGDYVVMTRHSSFYGSLAAIKDIFRRIDAVYDLVDQDTQLSQ